MSVQMKRTRGTVQRVVTLARSAWLSTLTPNTCCISLKMWNKRMHRIICRKPIAFPQYMLEHHRRNNGNTASRSTMFITLMKKRCLLGQLTARITNSNMNHIEHTNSTTSRDSTGRVSIKFLVELPVHNRGNRERYILGSVCSENAVIESRMKIRDTIAMTWRNRNIKNEQRTNQLFSVQ